MTPVAERITGVLLRSLDSRVRLGVIRRVQAMERELNFLASRDDQNVIDIRRHGWSDDRLHVFFVLNSVYQQVLGPMQAAARGGPDGLGISIPLLHGKTTFDSRTAKSVNAAMKDFNALVGVLKVQRNWLYANTCRDAVFLIAGYERDSA